MEDCLNIANISLTYEDLKNFASMKKIEEYYWDYIDNYNKRPGRFLLRDYVLLLCKHRKWPTFNIDEYVKKYEKYKKSIPTAGGIIIADSHILLVRINGSNIYSMPKGKAEKGELPWQTAQREIGEETGLLITITPDFESIVLNRTKFYILYLDKKLDLGYYHTNEIAEVRWFTTKEIQDGLAAVVSAYNSKEIQFSKQSKQACDWLLNLKA